MLEIHINTHTFLWNIQKFNSSAGIETCACIPINNIRIKLRNKYNDNAECVLPYICAEQSVRRQKECRQKECCFIGIREMRRMKYIIHLNYLGSSIMYLHAFSYAKKVLKGYKES